MADDKHIRKIKVCEDGPYIVTGSIPMKDEILIPDAQGLSTGWRTGRQYPVEEEVQLCRCGHSQNKPYCDGSHNEVLFDGTETASRAPFMEQLEPVTEGPEMDLLDVVPLCASARFCDRAGGAWDNTRASADPEKKKIAVQEVFDCPAGRLVLRDKQGKPIEPTLAPSISLVLDPVVNQIGPIWVKGGIPIEAADGKVYEIRNRVTLCRCGKSTHKPFCDGKHVDL